MLRKLTSENSHLGRPLLLVTTFPFYLSIISNILSEILLKIETKSKFSTAKHYEGNLSMLLVSIFLLQRFYTDFLIVHFHRR